jgi:hypothetical protein
MYAKTDGRVSKPVGEEHVVPMTRWRESFEASCARPRIGDLEDLEGRARKGELEGVSFKRPLEGVAAMFPPLTLDDGILVGLSSRRLSSVDLDGAMVKYEKGKHRGLKERREHCNIFLYDKRTTVELKNEQPIPITHEQKSSRSKMMFAKVDGGRCKSGSCCGPVGANGSEIQKVRNGNI